MTSRTWYRTMVALLTVALAIGLTACGSSKKSSSSSSGPSAPSGQPGKGKPAITLGAKNFTEEFILGQLYKQALEAKGFKVSLKNNIGSSEIIDKAITSGKVDAYPEYTGVIAQELTHSNTQAKSAQATYAKAKKFEEGRGLTVLDKSPGYDADVNVVKPAYAKKYGLKSTADLKKVGKFKFGAPPENKTRYQGIVGMRKVYGLNNAVFTPLAIGLRYQALDSGKIDVAAGFTTEGQLVDKGKYQTLTDPKGVVGFQNIVLVANKKKLAKLGQGFTQTVNAVTAKLSNEALQKMNGAVDLDKQKPADVAGKFLQANGLK
ncbi:MAG: osmoprotectant transport system substrate-binding protein [Thermoleophilaceae bacterium]|nr:osmoprotectant transport system substrate-binding protein [Thermoleophilaceae bacterium]